MKTALSIALVTETYPPELNGVALTVERALHHLLERGHRVGLVRPRQAADRVGMPAATIPADTLCVRGLPLPRYPALQLGLPAPLQLLRHWRQTRPDVVHVVTEGPLGWSALFAARQLGIPVTSDYRTHFQKYSGYYRLGHLAQVIDATLRSFHNRTDLTFVATAALADELRGCGYRHLACVGRGVDTDLFSARRRRAALRASWGVGAGQLAVLHVGRLAPEKNPAVVLEAFRAVRRAHPGARLVWVGEGPLRGQLERDAVDQVFAGVQRGVALAEHFASADLFLFPSLTETFGNVTLEAMASGLPIVAYDLGAAREHLVDGVCARVLPPAGAEGFIEAACALAGDGEARRAFGAAARQVAEQLAWPRILDRFEAHLAAQVARNVPAGDVATVA
ncbi:glycosyltransferase family 4 protein [Aromatoleum aromaticum]|nr:glycosyltransferase family 1 protein [Aromatoleum aromaticum]NMG56461.1 glycosyltransferase [Aromatoleum aromaticum]